MIWLQNGGMCRADDTPTLLIGTDIEASRRVLVERLQLSLREVQPVLREDVGAALAVEGKLLHQPASVLDGRWALLPFTLARDLHSDVDIHLASTVAVAVECVICSTDLLDDAMDADGTTFVRQVGEPRALNVALALLCLAQHMLLSLTNATLPAALLLQMSDALQKALLLATAGQQQDLLAEDRLACELSREECIAIAAAKAGTLLSLTCQLGALCAGVEETRLAQCVEMGRLLGIAAQLDNDAHDLSSLLRPAGEMVQSQKSDLVRAKKTLPIVLAAHSLRITHGWNEQRIDAALRNLATLGDEEQATCLGALREGSVAAWGIALLYRERARDCLRALEGDKAVSHTLRLILGLHRTLPTT